MEYQVNQKTKLFVVKVVHLVPNVQTLAGHVVGTIHLAPTVHSTKDQVSSPELDFLFFTRIMLEITNM